MSLTGSLTYSGVEMTHDSGVPTLEDIGVALSRQPRFCGHTRAEWQVLDHSLFVERLAACLPFDPLVRRALRAAALLHDAHEAITSDISTHFKTRGMRKIQAKIDRRIMEAYMPGGSIAYDAFAPEIKALDRRALLAEALVLHNAISEENIVRYFGEQPRPDDVAALEEYRRRTCWRPAPAGWFQEVYRGIIEG